MAVYIKPKKIWTSRKNIKYKILQDMVHLLYYIEPLLRSLGRSRHTLGKMPSPLITILSGSKEATCSWNVFLKTSGIPGRQNTEALISSFALTWPFKQDIPKYTSRYLILLQIIIYNVQYRMLVHIHIIDLQHSHTANFSMIYMDRV